jgi:hypothetical protein
VLQLWHLADLHKSELILEHNVVETLQAAILLLASISFAAQGCYSRKHRPLLLFLSSLALAAVIREQDAFLETNLPYVSWYFCWLFPIAAIINIIRKRRTLGDSIVTFLSSSSFHMMVTALVVILPVAQLLGHRSFLVDMVNDPDVDAILLRRALEEPIELLGYLQILLASLELHIEHMLNKDED